MTREEKINMLLAFLAPLLFAGKNEDDSAPQITFLSATEVQIDEFPGVKLVINKELTDNPLRDAFQKIANYSIAEEQKHWECCVHEQCEEKDFDEIDGEVVYNRELVPDHIYHSLRLCCEMIE